MKVLAKESQNKDAPNLTETLHEVPAFSASKDDDSYNWALNQLEVLRGRRYLALDWDGLAEELEAMAHRDEREVISHLRILLLHLLKWAYAAVRRSERSWTNSIVEARQELSLILDGSRTLANKFPEFLGKAYEQGRARAGAQMNLPKRDWDHLFPTECPWTQAQLLNEDFYPAISDQADGRAR